MTNGDSETVIEMLGDYGFLADTDWNGTAIKIASLRGDGENALTANLYVTYVITVNGPAAGVDPETEEADNVAHNFPLWVDKAFNFRGGAGAGVRPTWAR